MFESFTQFDFHPQARETGQRAFGMLVGQVEAGQQEAILPTGNPLPFARVAWSMVHGVANCSRLPFSGRAEVLRFADTATAALWLGLAHAFRRRLDNFRPHLEQWRIPVTGC